MTETAGASPAPSAPAPAAESAAPMTTAEAAASVIENFAAQEAEAGITVSGETPVPSDDLPAFTPGLGEDAPPPTVAPPPPAPVEAQPPVALSEAEQLMADAGYPNERWADGKPRYIPHHKVRTIIENALKEGKGKFGDQLQTVSHERDAYRRGLSEMMNDLRGDPDAFLQKLARADPRYRERLSNGNGHAKQPAERPRPDLPLSDGSSTYSDEGLQKLLEWHADRVKETLQTEIAPLKEMEQRARQQAKRDEAEAHFASQANAVMEDARTWHGFAEHEAAILQALQADSAQAQATGQPRKLTLEGAYRQVVIPRLVESDTAKRARLLKEAAAAPRAPAVGRDGGGTPRSTSGNVRTSDIAAQVIARLERG